MLKSEAINLFGGQGKLLAEVLNQTPSSVYLWPDELPEKTETLVIGAAIKCGLLKLQKDRNHDLLYKPNSKTEDDTARQVGETRRRLKILEFLRRSEAARNRLTAR